MGAMGSTRSDENVERVVRIVVSVAYLGVVVWTADTQLDGALLAPVRPWLARARGFAGAWMDGWRAVQAAEQATAEFAAQRVIPKRRPFTTPQED